MFTVLHLYLEVTVIRVNVLPELYHRLFHAAIVKAFDLKEVSTLSD